jgi:hypothetical protein
MMNRKFSIVQKIDMTELDNMIDRYQCYTGETNPYLFMNESTINAIPIIDDTLYNIRQISAKINGIAGFYHGYKIFRDDSLDFGEVEIR